MSVLTEEQVDQIAAQVLDVLHGKTVHPGPAETNESRPQQRGVFETVDQAVNAAQAAKILGISRTLLYQMNSSGRLGPMPIKLSSRCTRWSVNELVQWVDAGCPARRQWLSSEKSRAHF